MKKASCGWIILLSVFFMIIVGMILLYLAIVNSKQEFSNSLKQNCEDSSYYPYQGSLSNINSGEYQKEVAQFLLDVSMNVSRTNCPNLGEFPLPPGYTESKRIIGLDPSSGNRRVFAFYISSPTSTIIAFLGTMFADEWLTDFNYPQIPGTALNNYREGVDVHKGFYEIYLNIKDEIHQLWNSNPTEELIITGHSLGGGLANICSFDFGKINHLSYTFASPRSGNDVFAVVYNRINPNTYRIFNSEDIVPNLPPSIWLSYVYDHIGKPITFTKNLGTRSRNHDQAYICCLPQN